MIQDRIKMNGTVIWQPDKDMGYSFETTYTEGSTRSQAGEGHFTPMFTVEQYSYKASNIPVELSCGMPVQDAASLWEPFLFYMMIFRSRQSLPEIIPSGR